MVSQQPLGLLQTVPMDTWRRDALWKQHATSLHSRGKPKLGAPNVPGCEARAINCVCKVSTASRLWQQDDACRSSGWKNISTKATKGGDPPSFHHVPRNNFNELLAAKSGTCKNMEHHQFTNVSTYMCSGGRLHTPLKLFEASAQAKCTPVCNKDDLNSTHHTCDPVRPLSLVCLLQHSCFVLSSKPCCTLQVAAIACNIKDHAVQVRSHLAKELSEWVNRELCKRESTS